MWLFGVPQHLSGHCIQGVDPEITFGIGSHVGDSPAHQGGILHPIAGIVAPQQFTGPGIQGVHVVVVGPHVHGSAGDSWRRPYDVTRLETPPQLSCERVQGINIVIVRSNVYHSRGDCRRIESPAPGGGSARGRTHPTAPVHRRTKAAREYTPGGPR